VTGRVGRPIVKALIDADFNVTVVARKSSFNPEESNGAISVTSGYAYESLEAIISGVAAGPPITAQKVMVDTAIQAGVKRSIPSEHVAQPIEDFKKLMAPKTELIGYLWEKFNVNNNQGIHSGAWGFLVSERTATIFDTGEAHFGSTPIPTMVQSVASVLQRPADSANQYLSIRSFVVSQSEILAALEGIARSKWSVSYVDAGDIRLEGWRLLAGGNPKQGIESIIRGALFQGQRDNSVSQDALANT
ncbi:hypothetical protein MKX08_007487, partial [Trichoderma sp. CBMAI-0020]